jgi:acyl-CoA synthetase (AMP-forming)/AMP-acid ligase II
VIAASASILCACPKEPWKPVGDLFKCQTKSRLWDAWSLRACRELALIGISKGGRGVEREGGWKSIGDMGWMDEEGYLYLADRRTDLILRSGANIYPAEVEAALDAHPDIGSSVAIGLPDAEMGQQVHAIVQLKAEAAERLNAVDLHRFLTERIARYKVPESYEFTENYLRDDAGKVRRSALRDERVTWLREGRAFRIEVAYHFEEPQRH